MDPDQNYILYPWYFDSENLPACPANWDSNYECNDNCPYSHKRPEVAANIYIPESLQDPVGFMEYIRDAFNQDLALAGYRQTPLDMTEDMIQDYNVLEKFLDDMHQFEVEQIDDMEDVVPVCCFFKETGNCPFVPGCIFPHEDEFSMIEKMQKREAWYAISHDCPCCRGFALKCQREECAKNQKCLMCDPNNEIKLD